VPKPSPVERLATVIVIDMTDVSQRIEVPPQGIRRPFARNASCFVDRSTGASSRRPVENIAPAQLAVPAMTSPAICIACRCCCSIAWVRVPSRNCLLGYDGDGMSFKRRVLSALGKDLLLEIGRGLELDVTTRMGVEELRDVLAKSKRAKLDAIVQESLSRDTLKDICDAVGLDNTGNEKAALVERILAAGGGKIADGVGYTIDPSATKASRAAEGGASFGALLPGLRHVPATKPTKSKAKTEKRRRGGVTEADAVIAGTLKAALQQFALGAAGGYSGRDAHLAFTTHLLESFGWKAGRPEGAAIPKRFAIADAGQRTEREVALWWGERRTLMEVAAHDAVLDFAWKDLVRVCLQLDPIPQYVVLTNQRDLQLYDLARDRESPRLAIRIDDLPKYSEAFPFFTKEWVPGATPKIVNVEKVSAEVADLVARLYRSVRAAHPARDRDVIRFTLQCITAMFAEDIGMLP
jgi:hypothetical protein